MIYLYEYKNQFFWGTTEEVNHFLDFLNEIWQKRQYNPFAWQQHFNTFEEKNISDVSSPSIQQFVSIDRHNYLQAKNYVGIIRYASKTVHLLPKIFYQNEGNPKVTKETLSFVHQQLMRWLSYSSKISFPMVEGHYQSHTKADIAEIMIFTFAHYTHQLLQQQSFTTYETVNKNTAYVKGRLNTTQYVTKHLSAGKWQEIPCEFDQYGLDNTFNRILKYTVTQLLNLSQSRKSQDLLQQILQSLLNVKTQNYEAADCDQVQLHPLFEEWQLVLNYCRLFLASSASFSPYKATKALAFLMPMEQLFEHFVYGFLQKHFKQWQPTFQDNSTFLALDEEQNPAFQLQYDISLNVEGKPFIIDCKYKVIRFEGGKAKGVDVKDLYQIAAYAVRRGCQRVCLIYPNTIQDCEDTNHTLKQSTYFDIKESFSGQVIRVWIAKIPLISRKNTTEWESKMKNVFEELVA
ncbi:MAG: McrC family protein [Chitinophagales bacterium]